MKKYIITCLFSLWSIATFSQSLLPDGSFEATDLVEYLHPENAFQYLRHWYPANKYVIPNSGNGTPDFFDINNPMPINGARNFWNSARGAAEGEYHVGIANFFLYEGFLTPESVGSALTQPLEADAYYHVSLNFRNKGIAGFMNDPILCVPEGFKNIEFLLDRDSAFVVIDEPNRTSYTDVSKRITVRSPVMENTIQGSWQPVGTCFQADGGERFFATTLQIGNFDVEPPCFIHNEHWDVFYVYYFDIDNIQLTKLPERIEVQETLCQDRAKRINIHELAGLPIMQNEIVYQWEDGSVDTVNTISKTGTYLIEAQIDCTTIPIELSVTGGNCGVNTFVPNAFSPNDDGSNDEFEVFISTEIPLVAYELSIYNRWGTLVFQTTDPEITWDGRMRERLLEQGTYTWVLSYTVDDPEAGEINYQDNGTLLLSR